MTKVENTSDFEIQKTQNFNCNKVIEKWMADSNEESDLNFQLPCKNSQWFGQSMKSFSKILWHWFFELLSNKHIVAFQLFQSVLNTHARWQYK